MISEDEKKTYWDEIKSRNRLEETRKKVWEDTTDSERQHCLAA